MDIGDASPTPTSPSSPNRTYFAALPYDDAGIGTKIQDKVTHHRAWAETAEIQTRAERAYLYYFGLQYGGVSATSNVNRGGDQGELAEVRVNHSRALAQTLFNLIAASKVVWQPVAVNSDYDAASQAVLAQNILEYYWQDRRVSQFCQRSLEEAIPFTEGFLLTEWDETLGEPYGVDDMGGIVKSGDIRFTNVMAWDVVRDPRKDSYEELDWVIVRLRRNRFELAARFPQVAEDILKASPTLRFKGFRGWEEVKENDDIDLDLFLHKPTAALPMGRETLVVGKTVLKDSPLSYTVWPLHRVFHSELFGTPFAYSPYLEILGVQELMDSLESSIATNQSTFATQNIAAPQGSNIDPDQLAGGMRIFYYPTGEKPPEPMNLTHTPPEVFNHLQTKKKDQEQLMGLNSVVRGEPLTGDQSGAALALLQAQAVQQSSGLQANYLRFVESVGNAVLELIRTRCPTPRRIAISGKATRFLQKEQEFTGESIGQIRKVMVEIGNPMSQTAAGRVSIAKELLANQLIKTPEQYLQVLTTGRLEPLTQSLQNELLLILKENEMLLDGELPVTSVDDDHMLHAREHRGIMANPDARRDPAVVQAYMQHIQEHEELYFTADPRRLMLMGQQPPPMMPMAAPPPSDQGGLPPSSAEQPGLPNMPNNPSTGEPAPTPDGATLAQPGPPPGPKGPGSQGQ